MAKGSFPTRTLGVGDRALTVASVTMVRVGRGETERVERGLMGAQEGNEGERGADSSLDTMNRTQF